MSNGNSDRYKESSLLPEWPSRDSRKPKEKFISFSSFFPLSELPKRRLNKYRLNKRLDEEKVEPYPSLSKRLDEPLNTLVNLSCRCSYFETVAVTKRLAQSRQQHSQSPTQTALNRSVSPQPATPFDSLVLSWNRVSQDVWKW